eukprot:30802-Pelagococcus_subviridis.AAC.8
MHAANTSGAAFFATTTPSANPGKTRANASFSGSKGSNASASASAGSRATRRNASASSPSVAINAFSRSFTRAA